MKRALLLWLACVLGFACVASPSADERSPLALPNRDQFVGPDGVSAFMERRCGALDCHGQDGRPLRIYSSTGLRFAFADGGGRDTSPTTTSERLENYRAVVGLEPEALSHAVAHGGEDTELLILSKPLGVDFGGVDHKGGSVLRPSDSDPGWVCLRSWLRGATDVARCREATF